MAEHALYMRDPVTEDESFYLVATPNEQLVCMVGGKSEKIFYEVRQAIMNALLVPNQERNNQIILDYGRIPGYYSRMNEPNLERISDDQTFFEYLNRYDPEIRKDFIYLLLALSKVPGILEKPLQKKLELTPMQIEACELGFIKLKQFINNL